MIADNRTVIIVDGKVLKVDAWLRYHPGGDKAIMHMVGRDATDEVNAYGKPVLNWRRTSLIQPLTDYIRLRLVSTCSSFRLAALRDDGETFYHLYKAASSGLIPMPSERPARIPKTKMFQLGAAPPQTLHYSMPLMARAISRDDGVATTLDFMKSRQYPLFRQLSRLQPTTRAGSQQWMPARNKKLISTSRSIQR